MKVVVDTNVLLSAAWRDKSPEAVVLWIAEQDDWEWLVSEDILAEYRDVLWRSKFNLPQEKLTRWENIISKRTQLIEVSLEVEFPRDQKDAMFLACALVSHADFMITGDPDFSEMKKLTDTTIISISAFKRLFVDG
jgi:putative PIN family toxin of toxin-antitoxin system